MSKKNKELKVGDEVMLSGRLGDGRYRFKATVTSTLAKQFVARSDDNVSWFRFYKDEGDTWK